jgi:hypothetical protein
MEPSLPTSYSADGGGPIACFVIVYDRLTLVSHALTLVTYSPNVSCQDWTWQWVQILTYAPAAFLALPLPCSFAIT